MPELVAPSLTQVHFCRSARISGVQRQWRYIVRALKAPPGLDPERIESAMRRVQVSHPILAARLRTKGGRPLIAPVNPYDQAVPLELHEIPRGSTEDFINRASSEYADRPLDPTAGPPYRLAVLHGAACTIIVFTFHHFFADAKGGNLACREFINLYRGSQATPARPDFFTYIAEERRLIRDGTYDDLLGRLDGWLEDAAAPPAGPDGGLGDVKIETASIDIDRDRCAGLDSKAAQLRLPAVVVILAAVHAGLLGVTGRAPSLACLVHDLRRGKFAQTVGQFSDLILVKFPRESTHFTDGYLRSLFRNLLFSVEHAIPSEYFASHTRMAWGRSRHAMGWHNGELLLNYAVNRAAGDPKYAHIKVNAPGAPLFQPYALDFRMQPETRYHGVTCDVLARHTQSRLRLHLKWAAGLMPDETRAAVERGIVRSLDRYGARP
jgi:condensation domain-containing protein